eukprot:PhF_6_TR5998/c0_g1_i1/m.8653
MLRQSQFFLAKKVTKARPSDSTPMYELDVEWLPRPSRLGYYHIDDAREWMMRETLDGTGTATFDHIRTLHKTWGGAPCLPALGDAEPKFPRGVYKYTHGAPKKFLTRWHKANHPNVWLNRWLMPRAPWHFTERTLHADHFAT